MSLWDALEVRCGSLLHVSKYDTLIVFVEYLVSQFVYASTFAPFHLAPMFVPFWLYVKLNDLAEGAIFCQRRMSTYRIIEAKDRNIRILISIVLFSALTPSLNSTPTTALTTALATTTALTTASVAIHLGSIVILLGALAISSSTCLLTL